jgi:hypothetical protein
MKNSHIGNTERDLKEWRAFFASYEIFGFHGHKNVDRCLLDGDAMWSCRWLQTFRRKTSPPLSGWKTTIHILCISYPCIILPQLTTWSRVLEKLIDAQLVKKFPVFYEIWRFIAVFTRARHWSLFGFWLYRPHHHIFPYFWRSILIGFSHLDLGLQNDDFFFGGGGGSF